MSHHNHDHGIESKMTFDEKLEKLLRHWIKHNNEHKKTYSEWMKRAEDNGLSRVAKTLSEVAGMTLEINEKLEEVLKNF
jgi:hypothetical protein